VRPLIVATLLEKGCTGLRGVCDCFVYMKWIQCFLQVLSKLARSAMAVDEPRYSICGYKTHVLAVEIHGAVRRLLAGEPVGKNKCP
jgi:hypothetical protein